METSANSIPNQAETHWYPLRAFRLKFSEGNSFPAHVEKFNRLSNSRLGTFAPTIVQIASRLGKLKRCTRPLACNYVFLRSTENELRAFIKMFPIYSPLYSLIKDMRAVISIPDRDMNNFIRLAEAYSNELPCYSPSEIDLVKGDKVKIIGGQFSGIVGILQSQKGKNGGRVSVNVANLLAAETLEIAPDYIQILQFAPHSKRIYDALDAFLPRLQKVHEQVKLSGNLTQENRAVLLYFINRYGAVKITEPKIRAKHHILLLAAVALILPAPHDSGSDNNSSFIQKIYAELAEQLPALLDTITNKATLSKLLPLLPPSLLPSNPY
ncbi:MAG: hypothetical protein J6C81_00985 [Muribaculaceae bacterium]|nr:hypothetical protein [Muribaculaceae bacterium]